MRLEVCIFEVVRCFLEVVRCIEVFPRDSQPSNNA